MKNLSLFASANIATIFLTTKLFVKFNTKHVAAAKRDSEQHFYLIKANRAGITLFALHSSQHFSTLCKGHGLLP